MIAEYHYFTNHHRYEHNKHKTHICRDEFIENKNNDLNIRIHIDENQKTENETKKIEKTQKNPKCIIERVHMRNILYTQKAVAIAAWKHPKACTSHVL